jgi:WD40 repeat protein
MKSPFKFLDSYGKDDQDIFFGRDREIEELYHRVFESKLMLVYGVSGTGKSSLIHCGLANKFQETDWLPVIIRRGGNMIDSMLLTIKTASITKQDGQLITPGNFKKVVKSLYLDYYKPVFFIFDQFEELFIFGNKEERKSFVQIIKSLLDSDLQCRFVFVLREEYMANITEFERYIPTIFANRVRIEKMAHINAIEAIKGPCKAANIELEEGFAETLLEKLSPESADVELTYLQVFLDRILRLASGHFPPPGGTKGGVDNPSRDVRAGQGGHNSQVSGTEDRMTFTISLLSQVGNVSDLLGSFLDEQVSLLPDPNTAMAVLKAFVSDKGTKRPATLNETSENIRSLGKKINTETLEEVIMTFVRLRILTDKDNNERYELRHDALAEKIFEKFSLAEKELIELKQFIDSAYQTYLKRRLLLTYDDLNYISNKDSFLNLNNELSEFLKESRKHQQAKKRTVRRLTIISAFSFFILICTLGYYVLTKLTQVKSNYFAVTSISQASDLRKRLALAGEAWAKAPGALPREALLKSFNDILNSSDKDSVFSRLATQYKINFDPASGNIIYADCSKDNKYIFGYSDSLIFIWSMSGKLERFIKIKSLPLIDIKMSDNSWLIGTVSKDSILTVWNTLGQLQFSRKIRYNGLNTKQIFKFTKENNIIALSNEFDAVLLDTDGKIIQTFNKHRGKVNVVDISSDNNFIATASMDTSIIIWYRNTIKKKYDYYNTLSYENEIVNSLLFSSNNITVLTNFGSVLTINNKLASYTISQQEFYYQEFKSFYPAYSFFSNSDNGIITIWYDSARTNLKAFTGFNYNNPLRDLRIRAERHYSNIRTFDYLVFSNDDNYFIYTRNSKSFLGDNIYYLAPDKGGLLFNYKLLSIEGSHPFFTSDSKHVISIEGNKLNSVFVDINTIYGMSLRKL